MCMVQAEGVRRMLWYSFEDITAAYNLTKADLNKKRKQGLLQCRKLLMSRKTSKYFKYIVPETELPSLIDYKQRDPIASETSQPDYYERRWQRIDERIQYWDAEKKRRSSAPPQPNYHDYLRSEEWQRKRRRRLEMDGYRCQMCGSGMNLQVHHISYDNVRTDAEIDDLVTLCKACHEQVHSTDLEKKANPKGQRLFVAAVKALRENDRVQAWKQFDNACGKCIPPLSVSETSMIWQRALKYVYPL